MIGTHHGVRFWCNLDCCGALCALAAWGMIGYGVRVVVFILLKPWPWGECFTAFGALNALAFTAVAGITVTAHVQAMITNPGAVPRDAIPVQCSRGVLTEGEETEGAARGEDQETTHLASHKKIDNNDATPFPKKWCRKCNAFKPRRAHHCSVCSRCIVKMDHHCPWVNNCVGIRNQKLFVLFCAYTCALCVYSLLILLVTVVLHWGDVDNSECTISQEDHLSTMALAAMSLLFGLFTGFMACDQCQLISSQQTTINRLKGETHESIGGMDEVFGGTGKGFHFHWLLPVPACLPEGFQGCLILGYDTPGSFEGYNQLQGLASGGNGGGRIGGDPLDMAEYGELSALLEEDHLLGEDHHDATAGLLERYERGSYSNIVVREGDLRAVGSSGKSRVVTRAVSTVAGKRNVVIRLGGEMIDRQGDTSSV